MALLSGSIAVLDETGMVTWPEPNESIYHPSDFPLTWGKRLLWCLYGRSQRREVQYGNR
jgi:hypothetical protein